MNRVEFAAVRQVSTGMISPLETGVGVQPIACTPVALAALAVASAATAFYAYRACGGVDSEFDTQYDISESELNGDMSVSDLTEVLRAS